MRQKGRKMNHRAPVASFPHYFMTDNYPLCYCSYFLLRQCSSETFLSRVFWNRDDFYHAEILPLSLRATRIFQATLATILWTFFRRTGGARRKQDIHVPWPKIGRFDKLDRIEKKTDRKNRQNRQKWTKNVDYIDMIERIEKIDNVNEILHYCPNCPECLDCPASDKCSIGLFLADRN